MNTVSIADRVESQTQEAKLGFCVEENDESFDSFTYVVDMSEEEIAIVAKRYNMSPKLLVELNSYFTSLREAIHNDLADIWNRLK